MNYPGGLCPEAFVLLPPPESGLKPRDSGIICSEPNSNPLQKLIPSKNKEGLIHHRSSSTIHQPDTGCLGLELLSVAQDSWVCQA